jgi:hypothetical protein
MLLKVFAVLVLILTLDAGTQIKVASPAQPDLPLQAADATTECISLTSDETEGDGYSGKSSVSADGRFVAFQSYSTNLVSDDTNSASDVFVRDRQTGVTEWISLTESGTFGDADSGGPAISSDGRYVAFWSDATNMVSGDTNNRRDIFLRDRQMGVTEFISLDSLETKSNSFSDEPSVSGDGRYVVYHSFADNLTAEDNNGSYDVFLRDRQTGQTELISKNTGGAYSNGNSYRPDISTDGRYVVFESVATNMGVSNDTNNRLDIFLRDRQMSTTEMVSLNSDGIQGNGGSWFSSLTSDGRYVVFSSHATNLVLGDHNDKEDIYMRDRQTGQTWLISKSSDGSSGNQGSVNPSISANGRFITFGSTATNLVNGDVNGVTDVFLHDHLNNQTSLISQSPEGTWGNDRSWDVSISDHGRFVVFSSGSTNLVPTDTNAVDDIFLRNLWGESYDRLYLPITINAQ